MSFSSNPSSPGLMREILKRVPTEILDMIIANLLSNIAEQMDTNQDTFIQWVEDPEYRPVRGVTDPAADQFHFRYLYEARRDLHSVALASKIFCQSAKHYLYRMLEITSVQVLLEVWGSLYLYPANTASIRYLLCGIDFDSWNGRSTVITRRPHLFSNTPLPDWVDGARPSTDHVPSFD